MTPVKGKMARTNFRRFCRISDLEMTPEDAWDVLVASRSGKHKEHFETLNAREKEVISLRFGDLGKRPQYYY